MSSTSAVQRSTKHMKLLVLVFFVGFTLRLALVAHVSPYPERYVQQDAVGYDQLALNLVSGRGLSMRWKPPFTPDNFRTPVYPLTLASVYALFGHRPFVMLYLQALMGSLTILLVYLIAEKMVNASAGLFAASLFAISPHSIAYAALLWSETEYTLLLALSTFFTMIMMARREFKWILASSICLGIATLTHPRSLYLPFLFIILLIAVGIRRRLKTKKLLFNAVLYLLAFNLVLLPWRIRNYVSFGVPNLSSSSSVNLLYYGAALAEASQTGESQWSIAERYGVEMSEMSDESQNDAENANKAFRLALKKIAKRPVSYAKVHLIGTVKVFLPGTFAVNSLLTGQPDVQSSQIYSAFIVNPFSRSSITEALASASLSFWVYLAFAVLYLAITYILVVTAVLTEHRLGTWRWLLLGIVVYLAMVAGPAGSPRFRVAAMPTMCVLAGCSLPQLRRLKSRLSGFCSKRE